MRIPDAVVLGGGLAGTLAAVALTRYVDHVTIVERDVLPTGPQARKGLPQARHAHLLWSGGVRACETLLPGITHRWIAAGARSIGVPNGLVSMSAHGWMRRSAQRQSLIICSRDLLDWVVRERTLEEENITFLQGQQAVGLLGTDYRVTGVALRDQETGGTSSLDAELVIEATGRASRAPEWLAELGVCPTPSETIDSGLAYATRIFRAPPDTSTWFPLVNVQADHRSPHPGQTATLVPIEGDRWLVTLSGTRGGEPPTDEEHFVDFARRVRHPLVGDFIATAEPLGPVYGSRSTANCRRYFERLRRWPDGFVVLGDALATYNPVYGHGMSVAAQSAVVLLRGLERHGLRPGFARSIQKAVAHATDGAWQTATSQDVLYPNAIGPRPTIAARLMQRYLDRLIKTANDRPAAAQALFDAFSLSGPLAGLTAPKVLLSVLRGPRRPPLPAPPLTRRELSVLADQCQWTDDTA